MAHQFMTHKLNSITDFMSMTSADFDTLMGTNIKQKNQTFAQASCCQFCKKADSIIRDPTEGLIVCSNCGHVVEDSMFDHAPEWKMFDDSQTTGRCGLPTNSLLPQSSLGTTIGGSCNYRYKTLQRWSSMPSPERSLNSVLNIIREKCAMAGLLNCIEDDAKILYKIASECKNPKHKRIIIRGKNKKGLMAATIFYACKRRNNTKSPKDIAKLFGIKTSCVNKGCKNFAKYVKYKGIDYSTNLSSPSQYIKQFCEKLKLSKKIEDETFEVAKNIETYKLIQSHTPISIAAACILHCAQNDSNICVDKRTVADTFNISEATLTKTYNKLVKYRSIITNKKKIEKELLKSNAKHVHINIAEKLEKIKKINCSKYFNNIDILVDHYLEYNIIDYIEKCNNDAKILISR